VFRTIKTVVASTQLLTIVGMLATVATSQNCQKKKRALGRRTVMNSFPLKQKKQKQNNWQKLGRAKFILQKEICDRIDLFVQSFRQNKQKKRLLLLVNFVLLETPRFALTDISNPDSFPAASSSSSSSS
jgi:hypothetical protein